MRAVYMLARKIRLMLTMKCMQYARVMNCSENGVCGTETQHSISGVIIVIGGYNFFFLASGFRELEILNSVGNIAERILVYNLLPV